jgi:hypothetical protein
MPLGKLADQTINEAYKILNELMNEIKSKNSDYANITALNN